MRKTKLAAILGMTAVLGAGAAFGAMGGAKKIVQMTGGTRVETNMETAGAVTEQAAGSGAATEPEAGAEAATEQMSGQEAAMNEPVKLIGVVTDKLEDGFLMDSQAGDGYIGQVQVLVNADTTRVIDAVTGYPAKDGLAAGSSVYAYIGPAMTMSLPPMTNAELVLTNIPADFAVPQYLVAAGALTSDGQGGYVLKNQSGTTELKVPADCEIIPYLTRQMVRLEDVQTGSKVLVWTGADGAATKLVLFNEM